MPTYIYTAKTSRGETRTGIKEASDKHELANLLRQEGLFLVFAEMAGAQTETGRLNITGLLSRFRGVSLIEKMMFTRHLAVMIKAGLSLNRALTVLAKQSKSPKFKKIINQMEKDIRGGQSFGDVLAKHPKVFDVLYVNMVRVGETGGNLEEVLRLLAEQMKRDHELKSRVKGAMMYPAVIIVAMIGIGILMMVMVVPKLIETFIELNIELPLSTRIVIGLSNFLQNHLIAGLIGLIIIIVLMRLGLKNKQTQRIIHKIYLHLPVFSDLTQKVNSARFARTFSSLIEGGVAIVKALQVVAGTLGNVHFKEALLDAAEQVQKGEALSRALIKYENLYPPMVIQMIRVGEETGSLSEILKTLADFYEEEVTNKTKGLSSIIEPVLMVIIGTVVGFFAISMIQPMYSMMGGL
jgi:type IV pilus assembly protein PilC